MFFMMDSGKDSFTRSMGDWLKCRKSYSHKKPLQILQAWNIIHIRKSLRDNIMKKALTVLAAFCIFGLISGCGEIKDAMDIEFQITYHHIFPIHGDTETLSYDIILEDYEDYKRYKHNIRSIKIDYLWYSITSNPGGKGTGYLYAGNYGSPFSSATKIAQTSRFAAGETYGDTNVEWINLQFLESLLAGGKLSLWAVGSDSGVDIIVPVVIKIEVTANPLE
jgi:hypothetical protein